MSTRQSRNYRLTLSILLIFLLLSPIVAQKIDIRVDGQKILDYITYMADDKYLGRKPNTPEFDILHDWVVEKYKKWGLEPAGEKGTFFQLVPIEREYAFNYGTPRLIINGREFFTRYGDFEIDPRSTTNIKIKGKIVFVGYGISAPAKGLDEYEGVDVKGKIVFVFKGSPNDFKTPRSFFSPERKKEEKLENWEEESKEETKIMTAYKKGASGIILCNPDQESNIFRRYRRSIEKSNFERNFIVVSSISERVYDWIFWTDPQMTSRGFRNMMNKFRLDIKHKKPCSFETDITAEISGFKKTLFKGKKFNDYKGRNIIAKITGTDPELKNQYVVIGAHFDHLGVRNGQVYNGADDNGSGSGVVIELARLMKENNIRTKRTIVFCLWTAEELGLIGSRYWVKHPTSGITMDKVVTYFNMDMVGLGDKIGAPGALNFPSIWEVIMRDQDEDITKAINAREGGPGGSDHSAFIELGIEAMALMTSGGGGHPDYHDTGDDACKLDKEILRKTGQFVLQGIINLGNETRKQLLLPDRQHIYDGMRWNLTIINPEIESENSWKLIDAKNPSDLTNLIIKKVKELKNPKDESSNQYRYYRRWRPPSTFTTGIDGGRVFNYNLNLMYIAHAALGFGRIDIKADDGVWFDNGLTDRGTVALSAMEDSSIVLHLINPSIETLKDLLKKARKPFIISGFSNFDDKIITEINDKKVLVGVPFDPENIDLCVEKLIELKKKFGDTDNLILNVKSKTGLKTAKKLLYQHLIKKGWKKEQIYAIGGSGTSRGSKGNLDVLK